MGLPYSSGSHDGEVPEDDKALGVSCSQALIVPEEDGSVDLCLVAAENVLGNRDWFSHGRIAATQAGSCCRLLGR